MNAIFNEYNWEEIFNAVYNGIIIIDHEAKVVMCNPFACEMIGLSREQILGRPITEINADSDLHLVLTEGKPQSNVEQKLGSKKVIANRSPIMKEGQLVGAVSVFQDLTELDKYKNLFEMIYDGIVVVDKDNRITMMNQSYCDFLGYRMEEVIGKKATEIIENSRLHIVLRTGQSEIGSLQRIKDRDIIVMRLPIRKNGEIVGAVGKVMFTDLHDLRTLADRIHLAERRLDYYKSELKRVRSSKYSLDQIFGESDMMREAKELASKVAKTRTTVLIRGESGTGKEWFAHAIHAESKRSDAPFIRVNCAAIPPDLMEAELFGYEDGAFTGAKKGGKPGKIELAEGGTLFLDEIGDMPIEMQVKVLRVLQEREVERIGGTQMKHVDIRIITATNRPLENLIQEGKFREDLYYRLNVFTITIPPLRDRGDDIVTTAQYILGRLNNEHGTNISGFSPEVEELFRSYRWPGNVRELQNVIERSIHLAAPTGITLDDLPPYLAVGLEPKLRHSPNMLEKEVESTEIKVIRWALKECKGNRNQAAELLGIHRTSLYRKLEKYNLE